MGFMQLLPSTWRTEAAAAPGVSLDPTARSTRDQPASSAAHDPVERLDLGLELGGELEHGPLRRLVPPLNEAATGGQHRLGLPLQDRDYRIDEPNLGVTNPSAGPVAAPRHHPGAVRNCPLPVRGCPWQDRRSRAMLALRLLDPITARVESAHRLRPAPR